MQNFFRGISFRLAKVGIVLALLVCILVSIVEVYIDYRSHKVQIDELISRIASVSAPHAVYAIKKDNVKLASIVVSGLMQYSFVEQATLLDVNQRTLFSDKRTLPSSNTLWITQNISVVSREFRTPLNKESDVTLPAVGTLALVINMDAALIPFYERAALVMGIGLVRSSLLVFMLIVAFHYILTKPLERIVFEMRRLNPGAPGDQRLSLPTSLHDDEFKQLVKTGNELLDAVDLALAKRRAVEAVLRKSEEHVRQIIDSLPVWVGARNADGYYIFANKALANFFNTSSEEMRGSHVSEFSSYFASHVDDMIQMDKEVIRTQKGTQIWEEKWFDKAGHTYQMHTHIMPMNFYDDTVSLIVSTDITELKSTQALMEHMAYHDALTGLPNRSYLIERLQEEIITASQNHQYGALMFIDLDQFKNINDSLGHPAGDGLLKHVASRLTTTVKSTDVVVRLGGDEFVVILLNLGDDLSSAIANVELTAERLRSCVMEPYSYQDLQLHVTCSIGIVLFPEEDAGVHELLRYADTAMYHVKEQGRNAIQFFNKYMADNAKSVLVMEGDLHKALSNNWFSLHFQPRVDTVTSKVVGAEALLRWKHPENGMIPPAEFIPVLETSGLIVDVGMWVLKEAIQQVKVWQAQGIWHSFMRIGVNISPRQFRSANFVGEVTELLKKESFQSNLLEMEITEGIAIHSLEETISTMTVLGDLGVTFAIDDFGTGYSSISYLKQLPVSILKIDQSFVRDITVDRNDRILVETISAMGNLLKLHVVAEGVETHEQLKLITQYGCQFYQGYLCSVPLEASKFASLLEST